MKPVQYIAALIFTVTTLTAQEIKLKDNIVYSGDTPTFSFAKKTR